MLIHLDCPIELERWERVGDARRGQIYLHFFNLSELLVQRVSLQLKLMNAMGEQIADIPLEQDCQAAPRERFFLHCATDDFPVFDRLEAVPQAVSLSDDSEWRLDGQPLVDASVEPMPAGSARVALVALAGKDAVCFPRTEADHWRCVCGRMNRLDAEQCVRCLRDRQAVFEEFRPETIQARYEQLYEKRVAREQETRKKAMRQARAQSKRRNAAKMRTRRLITGTVIVAAVLILAAIFLIR